MALALQQDLVIKSRDPATGKSQTTTITCVNPQATNENLTALARKFNTLTNNTLLSVTKERKEVLI